MEDLENRRNPERILQDIKIEEQGELNLKKRRGKLKIFFGYAAGVGKTYTMLDTAREELEAGLDVAVGYVEPHTRPDTQALLDGMEILPPKEVAHKGILLKEFDLDGALKRNPEIILVDELAHTNAKGCRHKKRYQDIIELMDAGIDVYTTVNVQHLESLMDIVASVTHIQVNERVPDKVFDDADKVELVDIEPEELIHRMSEGKVYAKEQAARAMKHFFTLENLTALREIALRRTADRVNKVVARERMAGGRNYYTGEHVLVCLSPSPTNSKVIRTAARMANAFAAKLTAVAVDPLQEVQQEKKVREGMETNVALARQFGAEVITLYGEDIAGKISEYAKENGVSKIVIGRTVRARGIWAVFHKNNHLIDRLMAQVPNMDIYVIPDVRAAVQKQKHGTKPEMKPLLFELLLSCAILFLITFVGMELEDGGLGPMNSLMMYFLMVVMVSYFSRYWITHLAVSLFSVLLFNYFFVEPRFIFQADTFIYPFTFLTMLVCVLLISSLAARLKQQARISKAESKRMQILTGISNRMKVAETRQQVFEICANQVISLLHMNVILYQADHGELTGKCLYQAEGEEGERGKILLREEEQAVASWVFKNRHRAGKTTDTLPGVSGYYIPVHIHDHIFGVLGILMDEQDMISPNDKNILRVILNETAGALYNLGRYQEHEADRENI